MFTVLNGYKTAKSVSPTVFSGILREIKSCIQSTQKKQYTVLFNEELVHLADMYVLNYIQIPEGVSVWEECTNRLNQRITNDTRANLDTRYNFGITIEIMPYKNVWYFLIVSPNEKLSIGLFDRINKLERFSVVTGDDVVESSEETAKVWDEIRKEYSGIKIPMRQFYLPEFPYDIAEKDIVFDSVNERAKTQAENMEFAEVFNALCKGRQIQPYEIPKCYEEAAKEIENNEHHNENIHMKYTALTSVLPVLTVEMLKNPCGFKKENNTKQAEDTTVENKEE